MQLDSEATTSLWMLDAPNDRREPLERDFEADVCIVGAGIVGLTTAYRLSLAGKSVVVVDDGPIAHGQSARTSAHLASAIDDRYVEIERIFGREGARLAAESHSTAIHTIEGIVQRERIACKFERVNGYLFAAPDTEPNFLDRELIAAQRAGLTDVHWSDFAPLKEVERGRLLCFPNQAQFHPLQYLRGLARAAEKKGAEIFTMTHAVGIESDGETATISVVAKPSEQCSVITAKHVVIATNSPVNDRFVIHTKQAAYRTYVVSFKIESGSVPKALYWDTAEPYHYVRVESDTPELNRGYDVLIVGGEDHRTGQGDDAGRRFTRLKEWALPYFPQIGAGDVAAEWSGQVLETLDGLAYIGRNPNDERNVYIATGDSGMGLTHGTIAGILLTDLICGESNPWEELYDPSRFSLQALGKYARENLNTLARYGRWFGHPSRERDDIPLESGVIERHGLKQVAVYKDIHGAIHQMSAICPHLGGIVAWNDGEKTWECPCHGSCFDALGHVITGPANSDLKRIDDFDYLDAEAEKSDDSLSVSPLAPA